MTVVVFGLGATGAALARWAQRTGTEAIFIDDSAREAIPGTRLVTAPAPDELRALVENAAMLVPNPAVPEHHPVFAIAGDAGVRVVSEIELAWRELDALGRRVVAITGTNGKTTVTTLVAAMLEQSGVQAVAAGNIGHPLLDATQDACDVVVAEVSSFQLRFTDRFRPAVAVWLNVAEDHLDWHPSFDAYAQAKARVMINQRDRDVFVFNADDAVVRAYAAQAPARVVAFSLTDVSAPYRVADGALAGPGGRPIIAVDELPRRLPNDLANALAAAAAALEAGATAPAIADALRSFAGLPHRVVLVGQSGGVQYYDDSKATNPHAALAATRAFDSVILIAGGRNKGNDLGVLAEAASVRAVVAIGEAAEEVEAAFSGRRPVVRVATMHDAVRAAASQAEPGDVVLLSPACASWDQYRNYAERGDDFAREVLALVAEHRSPGGTNGDGR